MPSLKFSHDEEGQEGKSKVLYTSRFDDYRHEEVVSKVWFDMRYRILGRERVSHSVEEKGNKGRAD